MSMERNPEVSLIGWSFVENLNNSLFRNCVIPNSNIVECRILWTEEAKNKPGLFRD